MTTVRLSDRQEYALLALADLGGPVGGDALAARMTAAGRETSPAGAHQAANGLADKGLAIKAYTETSGHVRYEINNAGRKAAEALRAKS